MYIKFFEKIIAFYTFVYFPGGETIGNLRKKNRLNKSDPYFLQYALNFGLCYMYLHILEKNFF